MRLYFIGQQGLTTILLGSASYRSRRKSVLYPYFQPREREVHLQEETSLGGVGEKAGREKTHTFGVPTLPFRNIRLCHLKNLLLCTRLAALVARRCKGTSKVESTTKQPMFESWKIWQSSVYGEQESPSTLLKARISACPMLTPLGPSTKG